MITRAVSTGIILVIMLSITVHLIEFFIPLSAKSSMNLICRNTLLSMEMEGGLSSYIEVALEENLAARGFRNTEITGSTEAELGDEMYLNVEADFPYSKLDGLFTRRNSIQRMSYSRTLICRKVLKD